MAAITTQQVMGFIQSRIAETHAAGGNIRSLLANPEIAFSLQILDRSYNKTMQAPVNTDVADNTNTVTEQPFTTVDINTNKGESQTTVSRF